MTNSPIPIIDLFAGPGGLAEGFSQFKEGKRRFEVKLSIEKDPFAHQTLTLRAFFRQFSFEEVPNEYYDYLRGTITREQLFGKFPEEAEAAAEEAQCQTLGADAEITDLIGKRLNGAKNWVLIGGPPCQAYSLVGRSRMLGAGTQGEEESDADYQAKAAKRKEEFEKDHRHLLYREYLKIIAEHQPAVFVMENVKGILSAKLNGELIFPKILEDLKEPKKALNQSGKHLGYRILSLVKPIGDSEDFEPGDYLIKAEEYGVPQARHRVILLGIRSDYGIQEIDVLEPQPKKTVRDVIGDLPKLTPGLSKNPKGLTAYQALQEIRVSRWLRRYYADVATCDLAEVVASSLNQAAVREYRGARFLKWKACRDPWYSDRRLGGVCNHETRSHIKEDLWRYFFCSCYGQWSENRSPKLSDFPKELLPKHKNVDDAINDQKFGDRFRVQIGTRYSTTITSHISKDGHYFIHPDPKQYRSFTVREAARLQTFPDNYFFEGPRTQQYHQVGNAVPPYLAHQIAQIASKIFP